MNTKIAFKEGLNSKSEYSVLQTKLTELETENLRLKREIEKKKNIEKGHKENEKLPGHLGELLPISIFETDSEANLVYVNHHGLKQFGYSQKDYDQGLIVADLISPADRRGAMINMSLVLTKNKPHHSEYIFTRKDNSTFPGILRCTNVVRGGKVAGLVGAIIDITERKQAEEALKQCEGKMRSIIRAAPVGLGVVSNRVILDVNDRLCEMTGYAKEELIGKNVKMLYASEDEYERAGQEMYGQLEALGTGALEARCMRKDGEILHLMLGITPLDPNDLSAGITFTAVDITERIRTEEALEKRIMALTQPLDKAEDILFEELFNIEDIQRLQDEFAKATGTASLITYPDGTPITKPGNFTYLCENIIRETEKGRMNCQISDAAIGKHDPQGPIIQPCLSAGLWNAGASITVGGKHIANWLIGQVRDDTQTEGSMREYARQIEVDEETFIEAFREVPSMSQERFRSVAQTLFTLAGQLSTAAYQNVQQARFISERKRAEKENEKLQTQLRQAEKMEAVGTLAGGIAHDFNNLLQAIISSTQFILLDTKEDSSTYAKLRDILSVSERAKELIQQLLFFSRKLETQKKKINLNRMIEQTIVLLERTIPKMIDIRIHLDWELWPVNADPVQIEQILFNLGSNAADSMPDGGQLIIETKNVVVDEEFLNGHFEARPGTYVLINVSDTGHGMDQETVEHIFEPFFTTKEVGKGTGLGLASAYGIVKNHGGFMMCYSEVNQGTIFKIYLPVTKQVETEAHIDANKDMGVEQPASGTETILLVDDEEAIRKLVPELLERFGYTVLTASSGEEALETYINRSQEIDLVIMDIGMPGMGGHKGVKEIVRFDPKAKVIIASGYSINSQVKKTMEAGALGYVGKPYHLADLLEKIRTVFDREA
jgi:PAS domain S-box-containing protein